MEILETGGFSTNADDRDREIIEAADLPESYINNHLECLVVKLLRIYQFCPERTNASRTYDIEFRAPEIETGEAKIMQTVVRMLRLPMSIEPMAACADLDAPTAAQFLFGVSDLMAVWQA